MELVAVDIGGTHARFALACIDAGGVITLREPITLQTSEYLSLQAAWEAFEACLSEPAPKAAAIALAGSISGQTAQLTNNNWTIQTTKLDKQLGLEKVIVINDFAAIAHAVATLNDRHFTHLAGPDIALPHMGTISVIGPGTGLGVAYLQRSSEGYFVQASEGGHVGFSPQDPIEDMILMQLRARYSRVSVERVVSGPGIVEIYNALAAFEQRDVTGLDDVTIWKRGMSGEDVIASTAIQRFCELLGAIAGDFALCHGACGVAIAGGLGLRLRDTLVASEFAKRFQLKGRFERAMAGIPVRLITHPQPGLFGAVAAFSKEHLGYRRPITESKSPL